MHFRHPDLVVDRVVVDSEAVVQDIRNQRANGLMPWPVGEGRDDLGKVILSPGAAHGRRMARRGCSYQGLYLNALPAYNIWYVRPSRLATIRSVRCAGRSIPQHPSNAVGANAGRFRRAHSRRADEHAGDGTRCGTAAVEGSYAGHACRDALQLRGLLVAPG